jgi:hypothetical protein
MTAETDIAAINDGGANTAAEVRTALTSTLKMPTASMHKTSDQTLTTGGVKVSFQGEDWDTDGSIVDLTNDQFDIQEAGYYLFIAHWQWESPAPADGSQMYLYKNGTTIVGALARVQNNGSYGSLNASWILNLAATDTIELYIDTATSSVVARGDSTVERLRTTFQLVRIG